MSEHVQSALELYFKDLRYAFSLIIFITIVIIIVIIITFIIIVCLTSVKIRINDKTN